MREKVAEALPDLWRGLSLNFTRSNLEGTAKFSSLKASLDFTLTPYSEYDELVALDDKAKVRQKEKDMKSNFRRTATLRTCELIQPTSTPSSTSVTKYQSWGHRTVKWQTLTQ